MEKFSVTVREVLPGQSLDLLYVTLTEAQQKLGSCGSWMQLGSLFQGVVFPPR
jgi:hypothetical protein